MQDRWGITDGYHDVDGTWHPTMDSVREQLRQAMGEPVAAAPLWFVRQGSHHELWGPCELVLEDGHSHGVVHTIEPDIPIGYHQLVPVDGGPITRLVVHPGACPQIPRRWGVAAQVYALWSDRSWGIGDLRDLCRLAERLVAAGGSALMVSPLHQPAPTLPQQPSPYYPSSRRTRNPMLIGIDGEPPTRLRCSPDRLIDHDATWIAKRAVLEAAFDAVSEPPDPGPVARWNAMCDVHRDVGSSWPHDWRNRWEELAAADPELAHRARFHQWMQHVFDAQVADVRATGVTLIGDLAVGFSPHGADADEYRELLAHGVRIGAPPDPFNHAGQNWGIPPFAPWRLRAAHYAPFIDTIRASLHGMGGLRIDHVMGLFRQYWIADDGAPGEGAYVRFPADELLAIVCLEAARAEAFVIGEDLGTVEADVRQVLDERNIACTKVVWFEHEPPSGWPVSALATVTTHDLPTIAGVVADAVADDPQRDRLGAIAPLHLGAQAAIDAAHAALLASPSNLRLLTTDDLASATRQPNLPGNNDYPSWRIPLPLSVDALPLPLP